MFADFFPSVLVDLPEPLPSVGDRVLVRSGSFEGSNVPFYFVHIGEWRDPVGVLYVVRGRIVVCGGAVYLLRVKVEFPVQVVRWGP